MAEDKGFYREQDAVPALLAALAHAALAIAATTTTAGTTSAAADPDPFPPSSKAGLDPRRHREGPHRPINPQ
jgi:hypothetical protein